MIIKEIVLKNFKSHRNTKISFEKGINLIAGRNGAGKSSILEAILVALYGVRQGYARKSELLQVGADEYSIEIFFELGNKSYQIIRRSGGNSELHGDLKIEGDQKINEWVERNVSPFHIFTGAVYVRQGEIETIISDESGREKIIRKITRIEDYENAWKNLGTVIKELENEMKRYLEVAKQKEDCENRLKEKNSEIDGINSEISKSENRLKELIELIAKISTEKKALDELKEWISRLNTEILKLEGEITGLRDKTDVLTRQKNETEQKSASLRESLKKLESIEKDANKYSELSEFQKSFLRAIKEVESNLNNLEIEKERLSAELKRCEEEKQNLERIKGEISEIEIKMKSIEVEAEKWQKIRLKIERKAHIEKTLSEKNLSPEKIENAFTKIQKAREFDRTLKEEFEKISTQKGSLISEEKRMSEIVEKLKFASGICPICGRELTEEHRKELLQKYSAEIANVREILKKIEEKESKMKEDRKKIEEALAKQDSVLKYKQLVEEHRKISEELKGVEIEKLKKFGDEFEKLKNRIEFLKENEAKSFEISKKFSSIFEKLEILKTSYSEFQRRKERLLNQLNERGFSSIEELENEISKLKSTYEEWIGLKKVKEEFDLAETKLKELKGEIEEVLGTLKLKSDKLEDIKRFLADLKSKYDEKRHAEVEKLEKEFSKEVAGLEEKLNVLKKSLESLLLDKEYLEKQLKVINESERKTKAIEKAIPELNKIRERFASYKNIVAEVSLKEVEKYASEIFEEFSEGKYSGIKLKRVFEYGKERLRIFVVHQGEERETSFLSGGELVALGIAFRLALSMFEAKGRIPLLIMDEPTPFLDEERRRKLVDITLNYLRRIPQVIIVSHDEELKDAADKVIAVEYRGGVSVVASQ
ncbi:MAG: DNA double-strand break repair ATPase Rad50 [Archaeoglobaceae archaeon]|nr:DNA double-strand break repair ATPase Rad50 [Archaeoglobaceae archaeon]MDW8117889.1 DNA double-strand break repair ATPase Rad50 [Archaeoglobaceae archaeon]